MSNMLGLRLDARRSELVGPLTNRFDDFRQPNRELRPATGLALDVDLAAVRPDDLAGRRQPEARPARFRGVERAEELVQIVRLDSFAGIDHVEHDAIAVRTGLKDDLPAI